MKYSNQFLQREIISDDKCKLVLWGMIRLLTNLFRPRLVMDTDFSSQNVSISYPYCLLYPLNLKNEGYVFFLMSRVMRKTRFLHMRKAKTQISFAVTAKLISAFVFATPIVQSLYFLNPKFQASSHLLWLYMLVCVGTGGKPRRPVFSQGGSNEPAKTIVAYEVLGTQATNPSNGSS